MTFIDLCAGIGNAVVPQLVEVIGRTILAAEKMTTTDFQRNQ